MLTVLAFAASVAASPIVSADWLQAHLSDPQVRVIYVGGSGEYGRGHIPGARLIDHMEVATDEHRLPSAGAIDHTGLREHARRAGGEVSLST